MTFWESVLVFGIGCAIASVVLMLLAVLFNDLAKLMDEKD